MIEEWYHLLPNYFCPPLIIVSRQLAVLCMDTAWLDNPLRWTQLSDVCIQTKNLVSICHIPVTHPSTSHCWYWLTKVTIMKTLGNTMTNFLRNAANALTNSCWLTSLTLTPWPRIYNIQHINVSLTHATQIQTGVSLSLFCPNCKTDKIAELPQGNRAMSQLLLSVKVRHAFTVSLTVDKLRKPSLQSSKYIGAKQNLSQMLIKQCLESVEMQWSTNTTS